MDIKFQSACNKDLFREHKNKLYSPLWLDFADYILKEKKYNDFLSKYILYNVDNIC